MFEKDDLITWKTHLFLIMCMSYEHQWLFGSENTNNIKICIHIVADQKPKEKH